MRESEEYLEYNTIEAGILDRDDLAVDKDVAVHAVNLAYKEGYNQAVEDAINTIHNPGILITLKSLLK